MQQTTSDVRVNPSEHLVVTHPSTRMAAKLLGAVWFTALVLAMFAHLDQPPSHWLVYGTSVLMVVGLVGGLALMIACTVLVFRGRKSINDRLGLFLFGIWAVPYIGVIIALLRATGRTTARDKARAKQG